MIWRSINHPSPNVTSAVNSSRRSSHGSGRTLPSGLLLRLTVGGSQLDTSGRGRNLSTTKGVRSCCAASLRLTIDDRHSPRCKTREDRVAFGRLQLDFQRIVPRLPEGPRGVHQFFGGERLRRPGVPTGLDYFNSLRRILSKTQQPGGFSPLQQDGRQYLL